MSNDCPFSRSPRTLPYHIVSRNLHNQRLAPHSAKVNPGLSPSESKEPAESRWEDDSRGIDLRLIRLLEQSRAPIVIAAVSLFVP